jgi:hypothetical protein
VYDRIVVYRPCIGFIQLGYDATFYASQSQIADDSQCPVCCLQDALGLNVKSV